MDKSELENILLDDNQDALFVDGFDEAILGLTQRMNEKPLVAYSIDKIIDILVKRDNMSYEEAIEYFEFNIGNAWLGEETPMFIRSDF